MSSDQDKLAQICSITGCSLNQASFFLDSAGGDVETAVASFFDNPQGNDDANPSAASPAAPAALGAPASVLGSGSAAAPAIGSGAATGASARGAYTLSGAPVEGLPAGWGTRTSSTSTSRSGTPSNPMRSNAAPRVTGFRDLASSSASAGPTPGGFGGFGGRAGDDDDDDEEDEGKDPATFFTGGAKSGLSVENPNDSRGGMADMVRNILNQARESSRRLTGGEDAPAQSSSSRFFGGNAHTLGSDEQPSTYIPDPNAQQAEEEEEDVEEEVAIRNLTFWQDGFSIEDGDLMRYEEHRELLAAIQSGRAPLSLLKVKHDQPVELRIAERRNEQWVRQQPPPQGPFAGSGNRLGSVSPFPDPAATSSSSGGGAMPGTLPRAAGASTSAPPQPQDVKFEVDRTQPTTQLQIRLRNGDRMVATFNQTHTVGDIRSYINASRPGEATMPYVLQTTFPTRDLTDDGVTLKDAGLLGSVVVQRPT
ncbi:protein phosphatase regulator [Rhodotorula kratochvilovae]